MSSGTALVTDNKNLQFSTFCIIENSKGKNCSLFLAPEPEEPTQSIAISLSASSIKVALDNDCVLRVVLV